MNRYPARLRSPEILVGVCALVNVAGLTGATGFALIENGASGAIANTPAMQAIQ